MCCVMVRYLVTGGQYKPPPIPHQRIRSRQDVLIGFSYVTRRVGLIVAKTDRFSKGFRVYG